MKRLDGRVAIITGAAAGIGAAASRLFAEEGASVVALDLDGAGVADLADAITRKGGQAVGRRSDVSDAREAETAVAFALERYGAVDVLVNNAGIELKRPIEETTEEEWDHVLAVNLKSAFLMSKFVIPPMKARGRGSIVNNSSVGYFIAAPNSSAYGASKAGMMALTRGMALELAPFNIRVNAVCPGVIDTPMNERNLMRAADPDAMRRSWFDVTPLGRLGQPTDVAYAMLFLASDESSFITGTPLIVDGGRTAQ